YTLLGGFLDSQLKLAEYEKVQLRLRGLAEITTDPKQLNSQIRRGGYRMHTRPADELAVGSRFRGLVNAGVGYTRIENESYTKSGLNPHVGVGVEYNGAYRLTVARIFRDPTDLNQNKTQGFRVRADAVQPLNDKWGALVGFEYTPYSNIIPG